MFPFRLIWGQITTLRQAERFVEKHRDDIYVDRAVIHAKAHQYLFDEIVIVSILLIDGEGFRQIAYKQSIYVNGSRENSGYSPSREVFEFLETHAKIRPV